MKNIRVKAMRRAIKSMGAEMSCQQVKGGLYRYAKRGHYPRHTLFGDGFERILFPFGADKPFWKSGN